MKKSYIVLIVLLMSTLNTMHAQRKVEKPDRGVVAVRNNAGNFFISWRLLTTDPENVRFNVYAKKNSTAGYVKLNTEPLINTSFSPAPGTVAARTLVQVVPVVNNVEGTPGIAFSIPDNGFTTYRSAFMDIAFNPSVDGLPLEKYSSKFVWPVDLDGDGEFDYVVDRLSVSGGTHKVQAYLRNGTLLWTIDVGPNVSICQGQDDMVIAYDMDGDGKGDVVIKSSDGTRFADGKGVNGSATLDTDNDGIIDYGTQNIKNPPQYITVIDGMTGLEKNSIEMKYPSNYTRTNKSVFMGEEYSNLNGHMAIMYIDGKHPSVGFIYKTRTSSDQYHWYYASAYGYNASGQWVNWYNWERKNTDAAEGHQIRVADVDFDGRDELLDIGYGLKYDGTLAFNAHIHHGDRTRTGDIDPERPGLETFAIGQNAPDMLGMILYDAGTGVPVKKIFLSGVGDVGRGECMDVDSTHLGYEFWSTMPNIYDAKGNVIYEGATPFPNEGIWWDGDLQREELTSADGNGFNADIRKYDINTHDFGSRLIEFAKMTSWQVRSEYGRRPAFFGDIAGDWREEVILEKFGNVTATLKDINGNDSLATVSATVGFVGFSTDYPTNIRLYCLMQNPAYRMQSTTRGYYQSAIPDYYLGYKMQQPPLPPVQSAKLTWKSGSVLDKTSPAFVLDNEVTTAAFTDGDDILFDISGNNAGDIQMNTDLAPSKILAMNPKGKDYSISGTGKFTGTMELVKSMYGNFILNGKHTYTGKTTIHEGTLTVNGSLDSPVELRAKGTLAGNAILNGGITLNPALNIEGSRLAPGNGLDAAKLGKITLNSNLLLNGKTNLHFDIIPASAYKNDSIVVTGDLTASGINNVVVNTLTGTLPAGTYSLLSWTGAFTGSVSNFAIEGISGLPVSLVIENNTLKLVVNAVRSIGKINWTGAESTNWDFVSGNFTLNNQSTYFVTGDSVVVNDIATNKTITANDNFNTANISFQNTSSAITLKGTGGIAGTGNLEKTGRGLLNIETVNNSYTGKTILNNALVQIAALNDAGTPGSLGMAAVSPANFTMNNSRLIVNAVSTNTNRGLTITGNDTINVPKSNGVVSVSGIVTGTGKLIKNGAGQLNLSSGVANTYSGGTLISGGTLALGALIMNKTGLGSGPVTIENGGKLVMYYSTDYGQNPNWNLTIPENQTATLITSGRCDINGSINGAGTLNYYVSYVRTDLVASGANFTGKINVTTDADGGDFRITTNSYGFPLTQISLSNMVNMYACSAVGASGGNTATTVRVGSLSGVAGSTLGTGTWLIGNDNRDAVFAGTIGSGATITKQGTGVWTLSGANLNTTAFNVSAGKLIATNTSGSATGSGNVTVASGATIAGTGKFGGNVSVNAGAIVSPGTTSYGTLSFGGNLSLYSGSKTIIKVSATNNDKLNITGNIVLRGTLELQVTGTPFAAGKSFTILTAGTVTGSYEAISPSTPGTGLKWNTSRMNEGILSVDVADGIEDIAGAGIRVYPTVVKNNCVVEFGSLNGKVNVELLDQVGKVLIAERVSTDSKHELNISQLHSGFYYIRIVTDKNQSFLRKVVKQ